VLARLERCNRIRRIRVVWAACVGCLESRVIVSGGFDVSESNAADKTVPYFCNLLQINPSFEIAEKKCNKKKICGKAKNFIVTCSALEATSNLS
jgi:hypothetical protein